MSSEDDMYGYSDGGYDDDSGGGYDDEDEDEDGSSADEGDTESSADDDDDSSDDEEDEDSDNDVAGEVSDDSGDDFGRLPHDQNDKVYLEFDGASKGNPGRAGAGAVLKIKDGTVITRVSEGLGTDTNNAAEYRALIRGLKTALDMGYDRIHVRGDSELVYRQIQDQWQTKNENMRRLWEEAKELIGQFKEFKMRHIPRDYNADADAAANKGASLPAGQILREDNGNYRRP